MHNAARQAMMSLTSCGVAIPKKTMSCLEAAKTSDEWSYSEYYRSEHYSNIRRWDEANGIRLVQGRDGVARFVMDEAEFRRQANGARELQPDGFERARFCDFDLDVYPETRHKMRAKVARNKAYAYASRFAEIRETTGMGLYLYSATPGSGKTLLCRMIATELLAQGVQVRWFNTVRLLSGIRSGFGKGDDERDLLSVARGTPVLVLDDIGAEKHSEWVNETLYDILDARLSHKRPTLFTSNVDMRALPYDKRILNRLFTMARKVELLEVSVRQGEALVEAFNRLMDEAEIPEETFQRG